MRYRRTQPRRGAVMVLVVVALVTLFAFVALAIDLGMLAVARTQLQDAVDVASMAGARTLNGDQSANNNYSSAAPNAVAAATANTVLTKPIQAGQVTVQVGRYVYVPDAKRFEGVIPGPADENWSLVTTQVGANVTANLSFAKVISLGSMNMQAKATAVHRPRDVAVVLDYSGSMRYGSVMGLPFASGARTKSNNPDNVFPQFAHYSSNPGLQATSFEALYGQGNITVQTDDGRDAVVGDFYSDGQGTPAFAPALSSYASQPLGDKHLKENKHTGNAFAKTAVDIVKTTGTPPKRDEPFETQGYTAYTGEPFLGYTVGPGYWGKTFFVWPPNPTNDWRVRYFDTNDNTVLWNSSGVWKKPPVIRYDRILAFIKADPCPFPSRLQSGRILYYDAIPDNINTAVWPPNDLNQRFWKDYIDYVLGFIQYGNNSWEVITDRTGYGDDYTWGTIRISAPPTAPSGQLPPYMDYRDNPRRPKTHFWFGPMTMVDFLGNYNMWYHTRVTPVTSRYCWWPGTCHESPMYACKLGIRAALDDIRTNHPNNLVALMMFSHPRAAANGDGRFNRPRVGLGRNYSRMQEALWYPPSTLGNANTTIRPYDDENWEVPRAVGGTCYSMGLMQAYNQFSEHNSLPGFNPGEPSGDAGGNGRRGAQKVIIFETDGMPTHTATASLTNNGAHQSYYRIRFKSGGAGGSEYPSSVTQYTENNGTVTSQIYSLCTQLAASENASPPGYSTPSKKLLIHCIGFGPVFAPDSDKRAAAVSTLKQMQTLGNVTDNMPEYKIIYGTETEMISRMQQAFTQILQDGVQVALVE